MGGFSQVVTGRIALGTPAILARLLFLAIALRSAPVRMSGSQMMSPRMTDLQVSFHAQRLEGDMGPASTEWQSWSGPGRKASAR